MNEFHSKTSGPVALIGQLHSYMQVIAKARQTM
jgi:hypothetical protein